MEGSAFYSKLNYKTLTSENSDNSFDNTDDHILARLKRLQIEENYIHQSLCKSISSNNNGVRLANYVSNDSEYYKFKTNLKESYKNIKTLFEDVKTNISNQDVLKSIDVAEIKMTVLELEDKIKSLKKYLQFELSKLKCSEELLTQNTHENPATLGKIKGQYRKKSVTYNLIVYSPVKDIINSSFKCLEVQKFQEFMANSENRCGGWNEYYHNIFTKVWNKYFQIDCTNTLESYMSNVMGSDAFHSLLHELLLKFTDFTEEDLISHCKWYIKYTYLKERQRRAIEKWRKKKHLIKSKTIEKKEHTAEKVTKCNNRDESVAENARKITSNGNYKTDTLNVGGCDKNKDAGNGNLKNRLPFAYTKPTKQWLRRHQSKNGHSQLYSNVPANLSKLQVPKWRLGLQNIV